MKYEEFEARAKSAFDDCSEMKRMLWNMQTVVGAVPDMVRKNERLEKKNAELKQENAALNAELDDWKGNAEGFEPDAYMKLPLDADGEPRKEARACRRSWTRRFERRLQVPPRGRSREHRLGERAVAYLHGGLAQPSRLHPGVDDREVGRERTSRKRNRAGRSQLHAQLHRPPWGTRFRAEHSR